ncbi:phosphate ABC transporter permease subunit PstC [Nocardioides sp. Kera G14]|uniref:phosphate ABC transporter permease subunit PstC n=1 Tax=Nocardioides sp. Kera G14 TaxID=2884264 RepID=UPI001D1062AF|nr:phosphate ABC transporter permease subunit PstC [Nocardioides sp. Kera G14]UDY23002.1 phosphate ABC transporter permease subunit PstC [Nocardioides sp. Kera G14]
MTSLPVPDASIAGAEPRRISRRPSGADAVFVNVSRVVAASVLVVTGGIGIFLAYQSLPTLRHYGFKFFTTQAWNPEADTIGIAAIIVGTFEVALVAMVIAFPLAISMALYITEYAPPKLRSILVAAVDLMAAVPSIVYGLWGFFLIQPHAAHFALFLQKHFGWFPPFHVGADPNAAVPDATRYQASAFIAGVVVSMMATPMACSIMRQVFSQTPEGEKEGALALGSTRWGMIRAVVLPFGRGGIIGGTMLALGRALGETMAVVMIISPEFLIKGRILEIGSDTVAATIALQFGEANGIQLSALLAAGFALFVITLLVNTLAAIVVSRSRSGADN